MRDKNQLSLQVLKKFGIIYGSSRQHFREVERICGVTSQLWIMQEIAETSGIGVSELATRLSIHQSTCSQLVEKLAAGKLIIKQRGKEVQRRVGLCLSEEAIKLINISPNPAEGVLPKSFRKIISNLPTETIQALDSAMEQVIEQLQITDKGLAGAPLSEL